MSLLNSEIERTKSQWEESQRELTKELSRNDAFGLERTTRSRQSQERSLGREVRIGKHSRQERSSERDPPHRHISLEDYTVASPQKKLTLLAQL